MAQDMTKLIKKLNDLVALDLDAIGAYEEAIKRIDVSTVREQLRQFQGDHRRHVADLSVAVAGFGGTPVEAPDVKGALLKGFTAITASMGDEAALRAMQGNEKLTNHTYATALKDIWPADVRLLIERNYADEQRHLSYIESALTERPWKTSAAQI